MHRKTLAVACATAIACISIGAVSSTREGHLIDEASKGSTQAVVDLAAFYQAQGREQDAREALLRSAEAGNAVAHRLLAQSFLGDSHSFDQAVHHFERAIALGDKGSAIDLARAFVLRAMDSELDAAALAATAQRAERILAPLAADEHAEASWLLGYLKLHGPSAVRDPETARFLLVAAADRGHSVAAYLLARENLPAFDANADSPLTAYQLRTFDAGFARLVQAAQAGHGQAAHELSEHYRRGVWVKPDQAESKRWAAAGTAPSQAFVHLPPPASSAAPAVAPPPVSDTLSIAHAPVLAPAAQSPTETAASVERLHHRIQVLTEENERLRDSLVEARDTIRRIESERDEALAKLAASERDYIALREFRALQVGADELNQSALDHIGRAEYVAARPLLEAAARTGHAGAIANLAWFHLHGITVPANAREAEALFLRAAELGNPVAAQNLSRMYGLGLGIPVDAAKAESWSRRALAMAPLLHRT